MADPTDLEPETVEEMTAAELALTERWFLETIDSLTAEEMLIDIKIEDTSLLNVDAWNEEKSRVHGILSMVQAAQEEFFVHKTTELRPPDQALIDETVRRCEALGDIIAKARRASAITALVGDLFNFVSKVIS